MEMVMANGFAELSANELVFIDGGIDWQAIGAGCGIMAAGMFAIACAPASALVGAAYGVELSRNVQSENTQNLK